MAASLHFLGTGTAFNQDGRGSQALLVDDPRAGRFLVDAGPTVMAALHRDGVAPDSIDRLFLTHLHGDHTAGWPFLLLDLAYRSARRRPFDVYGPTGSSALLAALAELCYGSLLGEGARPFELRCHEWEVAPGRAVDAGGLAVERLPMEHHPTSLGYVFALDGTRVGVSGDTGWCEALVQLGSACDLLVLECTTVERDLPVHVSLDELRGGRARIGAARICLVHLPDAVAAALAADPIAGVEACHDGQRIELGASGAAQP